MAFTVKELLESKSIKELKVVAGAKGIKNEIKNTIIVDNPDYSDLLTIGDVVITTGYPFFVLKDAVNFQKDTIKMLAKTKCAALIIKTKKYFDKIPTPIIETANLLDFPIIEMPNNMTLTEIDNIIKKKIGMDNESLLERTLEVQNKLMDAIFGGIDKILEEIVRLTDNPVTIVDANWKVLSYRIQDNPPIDLKLYPEKKLFLKETIKKLKLEEINSNGYLKIDYDTNSEESIGCIILPINDKQQIHGYIILWETLKKFSDMDFVILEKAATIFAFDMKRTKELENKRNKIKNDFFEDLITGKLKHTNATSNLAELYGIDVTKNYACIIIKIDINIDDDLVISNKMGLRYYIDKVIESSYQVSENHKSNIIHIFRGNYVILFLPIKRTEEIADEKNFSKKFGKEVYKKIAKQFANIKFTIGIGKCYPSVLDLSNSFNQALEVITLARKIDIDNRVLHFDDFIIYHFLRSNVSDENLLKFYETTIEKLVQYDLDNNSNLIETLEEYFKNQGNASVTAKSLYLHRNTLLYRLNQVSKILNVDLEDSEKVLELQLGLKTMKVLKIK